MNASSARAFCTCALAAKVPVPRSSFARTRTAHRSFHASSRLRSTGNGNGNGGKPTSGSAVERDDSHDDVFETPLASADVSVGRTRSPAVSSLRSRQARRRIASALPPVKIPQYFLEENVFLFNPPVLPPPQQPLALQMEATIDKTTRTFRPPRIRQDEETDLDKMFSAAHLHLTLVDLHLSLDFLNSKLPDGAAQYDWNTPLPYERVQRLYDMLIDTTRCMIDMIYPTKETNMLFERRPWWWWDVHKDLDHNTHMFRSDEAVRLRNMRLAIEFSERFNYALTDTILDVPPETFASLDKIFGRELAAPAPPAFDAKTGKRPIHILNLYGYGGKAISESFANQLAYTNGADLIRLDAYDLSVLVGDYLGQNWAFSRGPLAMLGFRAAELSGRLASEPESPPLYPFSRPGDDEHEDDDHVASVASSMRQVRSSLQEDFQKIRDGAFDTFTKWELLKIDKILDQIIRSPQLKVDAAEPHTQPLMIYIHDFVELSMTMEGTVLLNRLRALVDAAWQQGAKIIIFGTSASEDPSEEYQNAVRELSVGDFVVTRHIMRHGVPPAQQAPPQPEYKPLASHKVNWNVLAADYAVENINNINRMVRAMEPDSSIEPLDPTSFAQGGMYDFLRGSILPASEVYYLASHYRALENHEPGRGQANFLQDYQGRLLKRQPQVIVRQASELQENKPPLETSTISGDMYQEARYGKLNEYEKRIVTGQVKRENLRTSFGDVHVPAETISSLKLLTSLALVRPDAFSYGVLAADRIPGCLLYGPPGTGKTMLAKAVAKESGANMLEISGASINDKWVGESEKLIRAVFTMAKRLSPCVVFIDEADSILANRTYFNRASHRELINQFLKEWDGMEETNAFIMVATNRPFDLDEAVLRRLPRKLLIDIPTKDDRAAILRLLLRGESLAEDVNLDEIAQRTPLYSGSDLKNVCVAAAMAAVEAENEEAARHTGNEAFKFPDRRTLCRDHFERGLKQIPASISEDMESLKMIRKFDEEYGKGRKAGRKSMGFGVLDSSQGDVARVRQFEP